MVVDLSYLDFPLLDFPAETRNSWRFHSETAWRGKIQFQRVRIFFEQELVIIWYTAKTVDSKLILVIEKSSPIYTNLK